MWIIILYHLKKTFTGDDCLFFELLDPEQGGRKLRVTPDHLWLGNVPTLHLLSVCHTKIDHAMQLRCHIIIIYYVSSVCDSRGLLGVLERDLLVYLRYHGYRILRKVVPRSARDRGEFNVGGVDLGKIMLPSYARSQVKMKSASDSSKGEEISSSY